MNNNTDLFIKYLDDALSEQERNSFKIMLDEDSELMNEFNEFSNWYNESKNNIETDDRYFSNLITLSKERLEHRNPNYSVKIALAIPIIILGFFFMFNFFPKTNLQSFYNFETLFTTFTENDVLTKDLLSNAFAFDNTYLINEELLESFYEDDFNIDETVFEYLEDNIRSEEITDYLIDELSDNEFNSVYSELLDKNIL